MVATGVAMTANLDVRFQTAIADAPAAALVNPTKATRGLRGGRARARRRCAAALAVRREAGARRRPAAGKRRAAATSAPAPDFTGTQRWFNTPGGEPLDARRACAGASCWSTSGPTPASTASARCPYLEAWDARYRERRADGRRRPLARVPVREGRRQRRRRRSTQNGIALPGRPGQRLRHLERLGQPVLAGRST